MSYIPTLRVMQIKQIKIRASKHRVTRLWRMLKFIISKTYNINNSVLHQLLSYSCQIIQLIWYSQWNLVAHTANLHRIIKIIKNLHITTATVAIVVSRRKAEIRTMGDTAFILITQLIKITSLSFKRWCSTLLRRTSTRYLFLNFSSCNEHEILFRSHPCRLH